jgi:hypothetical protein
LFDFLTCIISFFLICLLTLIILVGVKLLYNLATFGKSNNSYSEETSTQLIENSNEDSHGDGLVLFNDPLFPEEFDKDDY